MNTLAKLLVLVMLFVLGACDSALSVAQLKDGDIIFHTSKSAQSLAIQRATGSKYSHMGLIVYRDGQPFVFEAVATVRLTPLSQWLARGVGQHYVVKRLKNAEQLLTAKGLQKLSSAAKRYQGKAYDMTFEWNDKRIYCSELVWKAYHQAFGIQIGSLQKLRSFDLSDPAVQSKMRERYGKNIPLDEPVIAPAAMFDSPLLVTVATQ